jgi:hypothetical protein
MSPGTFAVDASAIGYLTAITTSTARLYFSPPGERPGQDGEEVIGFGPGSSLPGYRCEGCHILVIVGNPSVLNPHWDEAAWRGDGP